MGVAGATAARSQCLGKPSSSKLECVARDDLSTNLTFQPKPDFLNFAPIGHNKAPFPDKGLNNFQKLLVHQCIRKEYPDLVTFSQPGFIQIVAYDKEREDARVEYRAGKFEERLVRQVGLRWLIEAIHGGDISKINPDGINRGAGVGKISGVSMFTSIQEQLLGASTVLVGHNLFMDLIYFYACFFGPLPDKVEDFQSIIHKVFPRIIDTKYLATHDDPYLETSELGQLDQKLASEAGPEIGMENPLAVLYLRTHSSRQYYIQRTPSTLQRSHPMKLVTIAT